MIEGLLRAGRTGTHEVRTDLFWLLGFALLLIATGIGLRDPWPADEPRFALVARDMVATGNWLIPYVGGDTYADKPPLYFWLIATALQLTGSLRVAFLLPSLLAGLGCVVLIYDLVRRLWNREAGLAAGLALLATVQFIWQPRQAQIDATLCFLTTLSLYGLFRHLLLGPAWKWYAVGWAAAGLGVITKGVGFLPLLALIPYALTRGPSWQHRAVRGGGWRWALGPVAFLAAVSIWLVPMLLAAVGDPELARYRDEILFGQTITRYSEAWHHRKPFWYFIVNVIPLLWLPLTALLPWVWPHWRASWRERDLRVVLPLATVALFVLFFSLSSGKRGVYVLPAVPVLVLAYAPFLTDIASRRNAQRTLFAIACVIAFMTLAGGAYLLIEDTERRKLIEYYDLDAVAPLVAIGIGAVLGCALARPVRGFAAYAIALAWALMVVSFWVNPSMNEARSAAALMRRVTAMTTGVDELGLVAYKEQFLLHLARPSVNFGHARWREVEQEAADAAAWLVAKPGRQLLVDQRVREMCFSTAPAREVDLAHRQLWLLIAGAADSSCVARGNPGAARAYVGRVM